MKKYLMTLSFFILLAFTISSTASAGVNVSVDNYFYVHSNSVGTKQYFKDKYGTTTLHGDAIEHDAVNTRITFVTNGLQSGEKLYVIYPDGSTQDVIGTSITLDKKEKYVKIAIDKTTTKETYVRINTQYTFDSSDGGTEVYYAYNKSTPTTYGSLGDGGSGGGGTSGIDLQWNAGSRKFTWTKYPAEAYEIIVTDPDGVKYNIVPATKVFKANDGAGTYKFEVKKQDGTVLYTKTMAIEGIEEEPTNPTDPVDPTDPDPTDPGEPPDDGGDTPTCDKDGCDWLNDIIFCPGWDIVMADLTLAIKDALPPPPDWEYVSAVFTNRIVPAMGQEIVNRTPEIARIIADEFQSREKAVSPPPQLETFAPENLPRFKDMVDAKRDLDQGVPNFTPDYSQDKPFTILDPASIDFSDNSDIGYNAGTKEDPAPEYKQEEVSEDTREYNSAPDTSTPAPEYKQEEEEEREATPEYKGIGEHTGSYKRYKEIVEEYREYKDQN